MPARMDSATHAKVKLQAVNDAENAAVRRWLSRRFPTRSASDIEDCLQYALERAFVRQQQAQGVPHPALGSFLRLAAYRRMLNLLRADRRRTKVKGVYARAKSETAEPDSNDSATELQLLNGTSLRLPRRLADALGRLPSEDLRLLELFFVDSLTRAEIADSLQTTRGAIAMRMHRIYQRIRSELPTINDIID